MRFHITLTAALRTLVHDFARSLIPRRGIVRAQTAAPGFPWFDLAGEMGPQRARPVAPGAPRRRPIALAEAGGAHGTGGARSEGGGGPGRSGHARRSNPRALLDQVHARLRAARHDSDRTREIGTLFDGLNQVRARVDEGTWRRVLDAVAGHPVLDSIHEDPMTRRSFEKPRGYAGDAELLDYIYRHRNAESASETGRAVYAYAVGRPAACAVRQRRDWLAYKIDRASDSAVERGGPGARVLSVACGHLREAENSAAVCSGALGELVALDSDPESLAVVDSAGHPKVTTVQLSIARLLASRTDLGSFDLVYSAGLYDYLEPGLARKLTARLFAMLRPGGRLLYTNFLPSVRDAGYMEALMGWSLRYRDLEELESTAAGLRAAEVEATSFFKDAYDAIGYCEVVKGAPGPPSPDRIP